MKHLLATALLLAFLALGSHAVAGERFWRWMGAGHGPGYHAYNGCAAPVPGPQTVVPGWYPLLLPDSTPAPMHINWPGSAMPVPPIPPIGWWQTAPSDLRSWPGP